LPAWFNVWIDDKFLIIIGMVKEVRLQRFRDGGDKGDTYKQKSKEGGEKSGRLVVILFINPQKG
jgi:hypothetical protein